MFQSTVFCRECLSKISVHSLSWPFSFTQSLMTVVPRWKLQTMDGCASTLAMEHFPCCDAARQAHYFLRELWMVAGGFAQMSPASRWSRLTQHIIIECGEFLYAWSECGCWSIVWLEVQRR